MADSNIEREGCRYDKVGYELMAAAFEVYNDLGHGFLEEVYHESLERELTLRSLPYRSKTVLPIYYKGAQLLKRYEADLIIQHTLLVELKAIKTIAPEHEAQVFNYLRATKLRVGYLLNFGASPRLQWRRYIL